MPQIILNDAHSKKKYCNIIVTQPRRIAARSIAKQVCAERGCELGSLVGYHVIQFYSRYRRNYIHINIIKILSGWNGQTCLY